MVDISKEQFVYTLLIGGVSTNLLRFNGQGATETRAREQGPEGEGTESYR